MLLLERPSIETLEEDDSRGRFVIAPLERGFGHTLGNSLRRTLLSSIPGSAVTQVQLDGAIHEFSTIDGVVEDVNDIILNMKDLVLKLPEGSEELEVELDVKGPGAITGESLAKNLDLGVLNPDLHIATLNKGAYVSGRIVISRGRGYLQGGSAGPASTDGVIPVDAIFSPVRRVTFSVEETSAGFDRLILDVITDKSVSPSEAVSSAASTLRSLLGVLEDFTEDFPVVQVEQVRAFAAVGSGPEYHPIEELKLSERAMNCLKRAQIHTLGELVTQSPKDLTKITNFGDKSLREVREALAKRDMFLLGEGPDEDSAGGDSSAYDDSSAGDDSTENELV